MKFDRTLANRQDLADLPVRLARCPPAQAILLSRRKRCRDFSVLFTLRVQGPEMKIIRQNHEIANVAFLNDSPFPTRNRTGYPENRAFSEPPRNSTRKALRTNIE